MPVINASTLETRTLKGADYGATISLILDHSDHAGPGDIVIVPPGVPHKFTNTGPGRSTLVCIHTSPTMVTEWLE